jgi:membrane protein DedA with SNARE-associated domain
MPHEAIYGLQFVEHLSYIGIFLAVAFSGYLIPIPEELILILAGYMAAEGYSSLPLIIIVSVLGAIFGDTFIYYLSGHGRKFADKHTPKLTTTRLSWYADHMRKHAFITIFLSRFVVGMRFFNPLVSGLIHIPPGKFISASGLSAAIYIPIIVFIGYTSHRNIHYVLRIAHSVHNSMLYAFLGIIAVLAFVFFKSFLERRS